MQTLEGKTNLKLIFINCSTKFTNIHDVLAKYGIEDQIPCLLVFDDLMFLSDVKDNWSKLHNYVMKDYHHSNCSLIFVCQDLMYGAENFQMILSNSNYVIIFQNVGDERSLYHVFQTCKLSRKLVKKITDDLFGNGGRYIVSDNVLTCLSYARIRTGIFKDELLFVYNNF